MKIDFKGYKENVLTFECDSTVTAGKLVKMTTSGKVTAAANNDDFIGEAVSVRGGCAAVRLEGYMEAVKTGTVNVGYNKLVSTGSGVKTAESGIDRLVIYANGDTVGFIL